MKRNTIEEIRQVLDAIEQGKEVQYQSVSKTNSDEWIDLTSRGAALNFFDYCFRIKPEKPEKKWRPFKDADEFIKAAGGLGAIWIKPKKANQMQLVTSINAYDSDPIHSGFSWKSYKNLLEDYTFADGRPCGILEEDAQ